MSEEEEDMQTSKEDKTLKRKPLDKGAMAAAVGLMIISWAALPFVYLLIVKLRRKEKKEEEKKDVSAKSANVEEKVK